MSALTDQQLMIALAKGDTQCLGPLYERYKLVLLQYFMRVTTDYHASNDLLMETFMRVIKYRKSFKESGIFKPWLYSIANNLIKDHFKDTSKTRPIEQGLLKDYATDTPYRGDEQQKQQMLDTAMARLPLQDRLLVNQRFLLEMPYREIAALHDFTENTARIRVCRALKKLNELLKNSGI